MNDEIIPLEDDIYEEEIEVEEETVVMNAMWGNISGNIENQTDLQQALDAKQDNLTQAQLDAVNSGITSAKVATYDGYPAQITSAVSSEADIRRQADTTLQSNIDAEERARKAADKDIQDVLDGETLARQNADNALGGRIDTEIHDRQVADNGLQSQIDAITSKSDVVDVVANYAALQAYDTSTLGNNDVVKVLDDETHGDAMTYYRWSTTTQTWAYIGQEAPYYSKGQMDVKLAEKQDKLTAGANIQIQNGTISATDTTYTAGNGLNLNGTEFSADTDVLATKEDLEGYYTKPETDNLLAPKLEAEVVAELPTTGAEGKLYLTPKAHTTQTATGNPITATISEGAGVIESFKLDGDTDQQSYEGKNLLRKPYTGGTVGSGLTWTVADDGTIHVVGTIGGGNKSYYLYNRSQSDFDMPEIPAGTYKVFWSITGSGSSPRITIQDANGYHNSNASNEVTISTSAKPTNIYIQFTGSQSGDVDLQILPMIEPSSSADTYEPFVGGQPSPSPDYPQSIQTVTGEQTVSINGTEYPLDLGSIELCKLGTYQDYIYKDGDDWKVHKTIATITVDGSEDWQYNGDNKFNANNIEGMEKPINASALCYCRTHVGVLSAVNSSEFSPLVADKPYATDVNKLTNMVRFKDIRFTTTQGLSAWLAENNTTIYYVVATPTDTTITDQTLIAQLEAIRTASLENGTNTITNTATGTNLAGDMEIGYYGYNPRNRYDKWLWLDINNEYEQIGS